MSLRRGPAVLHVLVVAVVALHGLVHLLGVVAGLGWAPVDGIPGTTVAGAVLWFVAAAATLDTAVLLAVRSPRWWELGGPAAVVSQVAVLTAWDDAWAGTVVNAALLAGAALGFASEGPGSLRAEYRRRRAAWTAGPDAADPLRPAAAVVTEADLADLPAPVATWVRRSGAVGRPRVTGFHAVFSGRIRGGPHEAWMPFTGEQATTCGTRARRLFLMRARRGGLPVDVLHVVDGDGASMRARLLGVVPILDAAGPEMDRGETVTLLDDLCLFAPAAIVDAGITWQHVDDHRARATWTREGHTVTADLVVDDDGDLVDVVSDDRLRASPDGLAFTAMRWSTPVTEHRTVRGRRLVGAGTARWHAPRPEGTFTYAELRVDDIAYTVDDGLGRLDDAVGPRAGRSGRPA
jgi:hypothetical protein